MIELQATGSAPAVVSGLDDTMLVSGMANVAAVRVTFDEAWEGLARTLVFSDGVTTIDHPLGDGEETSPIPHEVLRRPGRTLYLGVQGADGERVVLPTVLCALGRISVGADPSGDTTTIPDKPHWLVVEDTLTQLAQDAEASADRAEQAARNAGYVYFALDGRGHVICTRTDNTDVDFAIIDGRLVLYG